MYSMKNKFIKQKEITVCSKKIIFEDYRLKH